MVWCAGVPVWCDEQKDVTKGTPGKLSDYITGVHTQSVTVYHNNSKYSTWYLYCSFVKNTVTMSQFTMSQDVFHPQLIGDSINNKVHTYVY